MGKNRVLRVYRVGLEPEPEEFGVSRVSDRKALYRAVRIIRSDKYCRHCTALLYGSSDHAIATRIFNGDDLALDELLKQGKDAGWH